MKYYTNMNWTIIRPGDLKSEQATGNAILTEDPTAIGSIHREDVARLVIQALSSSNTERKVLSAIDPSIMSGVSVAGKTIDAFVLNYNKSSKHYHLRIRNEKYYRPSIHPL
jgi:NAD(P)H-binding